MRRDPLAHGSTPCLTGTEKFWGPGRVGFLIEPSTVLVFPFFPQFPCRGLLPLLVVQSYINKLGKVEKRGPTHQMNTAGELCKSDSSGRACGSRCQPRTLKRPPRATTAVIHPVLTCLPNYPSRVPFEMSTVTAFNVDKKMEFRRSLDEVTPQATK